jgi:hypothetical protein
LGLGVDLVFLEEVSTGSSEIVLDIGVDRCVLKVEIAICTHRSWLTASWPLMSLVGISGVGLWSLARRCRVGTLTVVVSSLREASLEDGMLDCSPSIRTAERCVMDVQDGRLTIFRPLVGKKARSEVWPLVDRRLEIY